MMNCTKCGCHSWEWSHSEAIPDGIVAVWTCDFCGEPAEEMIDWSDYAEVDDLREVAA